MKRICALLICSIGLVLLSLPGPQSARSEETYNPHKIANDCINTPCETEECLNQCELICDTCHAFPMANLDLTDPTVWNPEGQTLNDIYPKLTKKELFSLGDLCHDCHGEQHLQPQNHPVDIAYVPQFGVNDLTDEPTGTPLVCKSENDCQVRCVSCHKVHPSEEAGHQLAGMLQLANKGSALCASCHQTAASIAGF